MDYGKGYKYAHDYPEESIEQINVPDAVKGHVYYEPGASGYEGELFQRK